MTAIRPHNVLIVLLGTLLLGMAAPIEVDLLRVRVATQALLAERFPDEAHRLDIRVLRAGGTLDAEADFRVAFPNSSDLPRAHTQLDILTGNEAEGWTKKGWALLYITHYDSVMVTNTTLSKNDEINEEDLSVSWMETTTFRGHPLRPSDYRARAASGALYARRLVREGGALRQSDLRAAYAATTGDPIALRYRRGRIVLTLTCSAREPGFVGDTIRLYSSDTDKTYRARLTRIGHAEWVSTQ